MPTGNITSPSDTQYDALGQVTLRNLGAGATFGQRYTYPQTKNYRLGTLTSGVSTQGFNNLQNLTYSYDHVGNVLTIQDAATNVGTQTFSYDALDRLATATASGGYGAYAQQSYGYANNGNITAFGYLTNTLEYTDTQHVHAVTKVAGSLKYWYDPNGNATKRISDATYEFGYDFENRLTELKKNSAVVSTFKYDGDGNRVAETTGGVTTVYIGAYFEWTGSLTTMKSYYTGYNGRTSTGSSEVP